jgi:hypothetical protein
VYPTATMGDRNEEHGCFAEYRCRRLRTREVAVLMVFMAMYAYTGNKLAAEYCRIASNTEGLLATGIKRGLCDANCGEVMGWTCIDTCQNSPLQRHESVAEALGNPPKGACLDTALQRFPVEVCTDPRAPCCNIDRSPSLLANLGNAVVQLLRCMLVSQELRKCHAS